MEISERSAKLSESRLQRHSLLGLINTSALVVGALDSRLLLRDFRCRKIRDAAINAVVSRRNKLPIPITA